MKTRCMAAVMLMMLFFFFPGEISAQNEFYWHNPYPDASAINAVWMRSSTSAWAVGDHGKMLYYDGDIWIKYPPLTDNNLYGIHFSDPDNGWACGEFGSMLQYQNGNWSVSNSMTDFTFRAVFSVSPVSAWAVGVGIYYYDGNSWAKVPDVNEFFNTVWFQNPSLGWAAGDGGLLYKYENGSWDPYDLGDTDVFIHSLVFTDALTGYMGGISLDCGPKMYKYLNGGWERIINSTGFVDYIAPFNQSSVLVAGNCDLDEMASIGIYNGNSFENNRVTDIPLSAHGLSNDGISLVGGRFGNIWKMKPDGLSLTNSLSDYDFRDFYFPVIDTGIACAGGGEGVGGAVYRFEKDHWVKDLNFPSEYEPFSLGFISPSNGWVSASDGVLLRTVFHYQGGIYTEEPSTPYFDDIDCIDETHCWSVAMNNIHFYDGTQWITHALSINTELNTIDFSASDNGWAGGSVLSGPMYNGVIYHFDGSSWTEVRQFNGIVNDISVLDAQHIWVATSAGLFFYNGSDWSITAAGEYTSVTFLQPDLGYAVEYGQIWKYNGIIWSSVIDVDPGVILSLEKTKDNKIFAGGQSGIILSTSALPTVGIAVPAEKSVLSVFPNPTHGNINIQLHLEQSSRVFIELFDMFGKTVYIRDAGLQTGGSLSLIENLSNLKAGMYIIRISTSSRDYKQRIIIR